MGANGCGKTTLSKLCNGLLIPTLGDVFVKNMNTKNPENYPKINKIIAMTFQNPDEQIIYDTVEDEIAFGLENICLPREKMYSKIKETLALVGLERYEKQTVYSLSYGQNQRLVLACCLAMSPKLIILDEITSMLDFAAKKRLMSTIIDLNKSMGIAILMITHNIDEALCSKKVILMGRNRIECIRKPQDIFTDFELMEETGIIPMDSTVLLHNLKNFYPEINLENSLDNCMCANEIARLLEINHAGN